jgi:hypothetical protein
MQDPITKWRFVVIVALALLLDFSVYAYTGSDGVALVCAGIFGAAIIIAVRHYQPPT